MNPSLPRAALLLLAAVQFTNILDFMVMMPLGPQLMRTLGISPAQVGQLVSSYEWTSALCGVCAAFFIDRLPRKRALMLAYPGFILGTVGCAMAHDFSGLLLARSVAGAFGGVLGAVVMAFAADLSPPHLRGTAMGMVMASFSAASVLGVPAGLWLATHYNWEAPFWLVSSLGVLLWVLAAWRLPSPAATSPGPGAAAIFRIFRDRNALLALLLMMVMVLSHFTIIPFLSPYLVRNVGLAEAHLPLIYLVGGGLTLFTTPFVGRMVDRLGRVRVLAGMAVGAIAAILTVTNLPPVPLFVVLISAGVFFVFASGRFVPVQAITSAAVNPASRGAFMSLSSAGRDFMAGCTALLGGAIVHEGEGGKLTGFSLLGWITVGASVLAVLLATRVRAVEIDPEMPPEKPLL